MDLKNHLNKLSHHAYLLVGDRGVACMEIRSHLANRLGFETSGNPDYWESTYELFGIDEARSLRERASRRPFGERQIFVISFSLMHHEAQNALLKLLEEPGEGTYFFLLAERADILLPTLRSRLVVVSLGGEIPEALAERAFQFLKSDQTKRLALISPMLNEVDRAETLAWLNALEAALHTRMSLDGGVAAFNDILASRKYLFDRGSSVKMILEHLALSLPRL